MYIIVIGCGKVGARLATSLCIEGHDVVIISRESSDFEKLNSEFTGLKITGVPIDLDVLKKAGIENADALATVTEDDNVNIMVSEIAKEIYNVETVIARIAISKRADVLQEFDVQTICPTNITSDNIKSILLKETNSTQHILGTSTITFKHEKPHRALIGEKIGNIEVEPDKMIFGIVREGVLSLANPEMTILKGDELVIANLIDL